MKQQKPKKFQAPKGRHHQALFDNDLPFRPKVEKRKDAYRRKPKHVNKPDPLND